LLRSFRSERLAVRVQQTPLIPAKSGIQTLGQTRLSAVMAGLVPAIHVFLIESPQDVDARVKPAHDAERQYN